MRSPGTARRGLPPLSAALLLLLQLLLLAALWIRPAPAGCETLHVELALKSDDVSELPSADGLIDGLGSAFDAAYGAFARLSFDPAPDATAARATVRVAAQAGLVGIDTDLTRGSVVRTLRSTVPSGAAASLLATIAGDLAYLLFSSRDFKAFPLGPPPDLAVSLQIDTLATLTGWDPAELEPIGMAASGDGVAICFPRRWLTLGPGFKVVTATIRDIDAQASGRSPAQLSGIAAGMGSDLLLLSERDGSALRVDARGSRERLPMPGLTARAARLLEGGSLAALDGTGGRVLVFGPDGAVLGAIAIAAAYVSALATDVEGNLWLWDAGERRVRVLGPEGNEIHAIKPLCSAATMQLPQALEVLDDGSFLLAGSAEVWRFERTGIPAWRLTRIPGRPAEPLPASFAMAVDRGSGALTLMDAQSRRLLQFSAGAGVWNGFAALLPLLDTRITDELGRAADLAGREGLSLAALQYAELQAKRGGEPGGRQRARVALLKEKTRLFVELAESLGRDLLFDRADAAWLRAGECARSLSAEAPGDQDAPGLLETIVARRQEVRAMAGGRTDLTVIDARVSAAVAGSCSAAFVVQLRISNAGDQALTSLRIHAGLAPLSAAPALAVLDPISAGETRDISIGLAPAAFVSRSMMAARAATLAVLATFQRGTQGFSTWSTRALRIIDPAPASSETTAARARADSILCRAQPGDPLLAALPDTVLAPGAVRDGLQALAGILKALARARGPGTLPAVRGADLPLGGVRAALRSLTANPDDWTALTMSVAGSLGLGAGVIAWQEESLALVDTGIALPEALAALPGLALFESSLSSLSREGRLCVPLSGQPSTEPSAISALVDGLVRVRQLGAERAAIAWLDPAGPGARTPPRPVPFGLRFPARSDGLSMETLREEIARALESQS